VPDIAAELGVARSTAYQWVKHLPLDSGDAEAARGRREHSKRMTDARWDAYRRVREETQAEVRSAVAETVASLSARDLLLLGAAIYWCEGGKSKPWRRAERSPSSTAIPHCSHCFCVTWRRRGLVGIRSGFV
jgi:transposase-like protein